MDSLIYHGLVKNDIASELIVYYEHIYNIPNSHIGDMTVEYISDKKATILRGMCEIKDRGVISYGMFSSSLNINNKKLFTNMDVINLDLNSTKIIYNNLCNSIQVVYNGTSDKIITFNILYKVRFAYSTSPDKGFTIMLYKYLGSPFSYIVINLTTKSAISLYKKSIKDLDKFISNHSKGVDVNNYFIHLYKNSSIQVFEPLLSPIKLNEWALTNGLNPTNISKISHDETLTSSTHIKGICCVCLVNPSTHAFIPCGHQVLCGDCSKKIYASCPVCRTKYTNIILIWNS